MRDKGKGKDGRWVQKKVINERQNLTERKRKYGYKSTLGLNVEK